MKKLTVYYNTKGFQYDVYGLVKAFTPDYEIEETFTLPIDNIGEIWHIIINDNDLSVSYLNNGETLVTEAAEIPCGSDRFEIKNILKRSLYRALSKAYNKELPWGDLTGIRPTKLAYSFIKDNKSLNEVKGILKEKYLVSDRKNSLCCNIAAREFEILKSLEDEDCYSLYFSIPVCPSICVYCSFTSGLYSTYSDVMEEYINCLLYELGEVVKIYSGKKLVSIYIGGGTPSSLPVDLIEKLLKGIADKVNISSLYEFTFEAGRPETISPELIKVLKEYGVTRLSINPQTMNEETLKRIHRQHGTEDIKKAFNIAVEGGMTNINSDIIIGLPGEGIKEIENTLTEIYKLPLKSLTVHSLALKRGSKLYEEGYLHNIKSDREADEVMDLILNESEKRGFNPYYMYRQKNSIGNLENVGYSLKGYESLYNILMIEERKTVIGIGVGASTKIINPDLSVKRIESLKDIRLYLERYREMMDRKRKEMYPGGNK